MSKENKILSRTKEADDSQPEMASSFSQNSGSSSQPGGGMKPPPRLLLRRPDEEKSSVGGRATASRSIIPPPPAPVEGSQDSSSGGGHTGEKKVQILPRRGTAPEQKHSDRPDRTGTSTSLQTTLEAYEFPFENAVPLVHNDMSFDKGLKIVKSLKSTLDFLVVTAIGPPGSGKSTILNFLAGKCKNTEFNGDPTIFLPRMEKGEEKMSSFYISPENIVFIEMAPIFNGSASVDLIQYVDKYSTLESMTTSWNLRLMRCALSVSHLVLILGSTLIEPKIIQLIHSASTLRTMEFSFGKNSHAELVFVANKCEIAEGAKEEWTSICNSADVLGLGRRARLKPNAFALPPYSKAHNLSESADGNQTYEEFRRKIYEYNQWTRSYFTEDEIKGETKIPQSQTFNDWFTFASNCWAEMGHSAYFHDYVKFLQ